MCHWFLLTFHQRLKFLGVNSLPYGGGLSGSAVKHLPSAQGRIKEGQGASEIHSGFWLLAGSVLLPMSLRLFLSLSSPPSLSPFSASHSALSLKKKKVNKYNFFKSLPHGIKTTGKYKENISVCVKVGTCRRGIRHEKTFFIEGKENNSVLK